jgi:hypothetical protein
VSGAARWGPAVSGSGWSSSPAVVSCPCPWCGQPTTIDMATRQIAPHDLPRSPAADVVAMVLTPRVAVLMCDRCDDDGIDERGRVCEHRRPCTDPPVDEGGDGYVWTSASAGLPTLGRNHR